MSLPHAVVFLGCRKDTCRAVFAASFSAVVLRMRVVSNSETAEMNGRKELTTAVPPAAAVSVAALTIY